MLNQMKSIGNTFQTRQNSYQFYRQHNKDQRWQDFFLYLPTHLLFVFLNPTIKIMYQIKLSITTVKKNEE